jgi:hypothetical protein
MWAIFAIFKKLHKENNHSTVENSPNLAALKKTGPEAP